MTNIITMVRPEGIWQAADNRVTLGGRIYDDLALKQLHIVFPPLPNGPHALIAFTGLAEMPNGTPMLQWIRKLLTGETRSAMDTFTLLSQSLTTELIHSKYRYEKLLITGGIIEGAERYYIEISNLGYGNDSRAQPEFRYDIKKVIDSMAFVAGSGRLAISQKDKELLTRQLTVRPNKWRDHLGLLASINRRIADKDSAVSPWCNAVYLREASEGTYGKRFATIDEPGQDIIVPTVFMGIDILADIMAKNIKGFPLN